MVGAEIRRLFGKNLKRIRLQQGLSLLQLSMKTGLTHNFINDIETGKKWISAESLGKFTTVLKVEPYHFFISEIGDHSVIAIDPYLIDLSDSLQKIAHELQERYGNDPSSSSSKKEKL